MQTDILRISDTSGFISSTIIDLTVKIMVAVMAFGVIYLAAVDALVSLIYGVPYQNAGFTFLQNAIVPAIGIIGKLGPIAGLFASLALITRWFLLQASTLSDPSKETRVRRFLKLATRLCTANSLFNHRVKILPGVLSLTTPNRVLVSTSAGLAGATPLLF